ncbi:hypothetical protein [Oceanirhabdus sp. W0125-5]|uniref:hypothetical protein n=1 Tax=Oceanirhabdus sp. W0125-5 TaxID=2999116 RepID=UPI0022F30A03|nr:hypothetical protein [Oceanirhabdus sp. W0125-5]WBW97721.1 hypothetical protein OW730_02775 [Oceanirhabdus sp. W0125-5]
MFLKSFTILVVVALILTIMLTIGMRNLKGKLKILIFLPSIAITVFLGVVWVNAIPNLDDWNRRFLYLGYLTVMGIIIVAMNLVILYVHKKIKDRKEDN